MATFLSPPLRRKGNAIKNAETPVMDALGKGVFTSLDASGISDPPTTLTHVSIYEQV